jgi:hypothetical protein
VLSSWSCTLLAMQQAKCNMPISCHQQAASTSISTPHHTAWSFHTIFATPDELYTSHVVASTTVRAGPDANHYTDGSIGTEVPKPSPKHASVHGCSQPTLQPAP